MAKKIKKLSDELLGISTYEKNSLEGKSYSSNDILDYLTDEKNKILLNDKVVKKLGNVQTSVVNEVLAFALATLFIWPGNTSSMALLNEELKTQQLNNSSPSAVVQLADSNIDIMEGSEAKVEINVAEQLLLTNKEKSEIKKSYDDIIKSYTKGFANKIDNASFEVLSYNILYSMSWTESRKNAVIKAIKGSSADIVCLQEAMGYQYDDIKQALGFNGVLSDKNGDGSSFNVGILYDSDRYTKVGDTCHFYLSETPEKKSYSYGEYNHRRDVLGITLKDNQTGEYINVYNAHFPLKYDSRVKAADVFNKYLSINQTETKKELGVTPTMLVCGDFNNWKYVEENRDTSSQYQTKSIYKFYNKMTKQLLNSSDIAVNVKDYGRTHISSSSVGINNNGQPLDYIMISKDGEIYCTKYDTIYEANNSTFASDHYPIYTSNIPQSAIEKNAEKYLNAATSKLNKIQTEYVDYADNEDYFNELRGQLASELMNKMSNEINELGD